MARLMPRMRRAGRPPRRPSGTVISPAKSCPTGKGTPAAPSSLASRKPPSPANAAWARETWPTRPVSTTSESSTQAVITLWITAARHPAVVAATSAAVTGTNTASGNSGRRPSGERGSRPSLVSPRVGSRLPRTSITTAMTANGRTSAMPCWGNQRHDVAALTHSDCPTPISSPASAAMVNDDRSATSAAANAGTIASVRGSASAT
jgi:hypothetical protein